MNLKSALLDKKDLSQIRVSGFEVLYSEQYNIVLLMHFKTS